MLFEHSELKKIALIPTWSNFQRVLVNYNYAWFSKLSTFFSSFKCHLMCRSVIHFMRTIATLQTELWEFFYSLRNDCTLHFIHFPSCMDRKASKRWKFLCGKYVKNFKDIITNNLLSTGFSPSPSLSISLSLCCISASKTNNKF